MDPISHSKPWITEADRLAVAHILAGNMLAQGEVARELERRLSNWVGAAGGVATGSGSAALVLALEGVGVRHGDEVVLPTYVCRSVLEAVRTAGAEPVLCDVGEDWVVTADCAARKITSATKAVIVPHIFGIFADIESFRRLGVSVIEDCAQALDGEGRRTTTADAAVFSFHPTKCLTSGEGGLAVSPDMSIVDRMRSFRDGTSSMQGSRLFSPLSDMAAGLALSQLNRYQEGLSRRARIAGSYLSSLEKSLPECLNRRAYGRSMFFRFPVRIDGGLEACQQEFLGRSIHVRRGVDELLHRVAGQDDRDFAVSIELFRTTVSLPIYPALTPEEEAHCTVQAAAALCGAIA